MKQPLNEGVIHVSQLKLWSHVGVLEEERINGQWFSLDFSLRLNLDAAAKSDNLEFSADYSLAIKALQSFAFEFYCLTIEHFSEQILLNLEALYGPVPMFIRLSKCSPPVAGFNGSVSVDMKRNGF